MLKYVVNPELSSTDRAAVNTARKDSHRPNFSFVVSVKVISEYWSTQSDANKSVD